MPDPARPPTIATFPLKSTSYTLQFYAALERLGARVIEGDYSGRWFLRNLRAIDCFHIHWPSFLYYSPQLRWGSWLRLGKLAVLLLLVRAAGKQVAWTAHNLYPHDGGAAELIHRVARRIISRLATHVLVHGSAAGHLVAREFPVAARKLVLIEHGHWVGYYANSVTREESRRRLGIPDDGTAYLFLGVCKPYKNLEALIQAFLELDGNLYLIIAGKYQSESYQERIEEMAALDSARIKLFPGYVDDSEIQLFMNACDFVVLSYTEVLTSGSAMLALSFDRPVIAPAIGCLTELVDAEVGVLYEPGSVAALGTAMREACRMTFEPGAARRRAEAYSWDRSARAFLDRLTQ